MDTTSAPGRPDTELRETNRRFYDDMWRDARLVEPRRFNTWPLVSALVSQSHVRLEVAPGLRPRLPVEGTHFVDLSQPAIARLRLRAASVTLASITALPFASGKFDLVCAFDIVEHVDDENEALSELSRVCDTGGVLLIAVPLHPSRWTPFDDFVGHCRRYEPQRLLAQTERERFLGGEQRRIRHAGEIVAPAGLGHVVAHAQSRTVDVVVQPRDDADRRALSRKNCCCVPA